MSDRNTTEYLGHEITGWGARARAWVERVKGLSAELAELLDVPEDGRPESRAAAFLGVYRALELDPQRPEAVRQVRGLVTGAELLGEGLEHLGKVADAELAELASEGLKESEVVSTEGLLDANFVPVRWEDGKVKLLALVPLRAVPAAHPLADLVSEPSCFRGPGGAPCLVLGFAEGDGHDVRLPSVVVKDEVAWVTQDLRVLQDRNEGEADDAPAWNAERLMRGVAPPRGAVLRNGPAVRKVAKRVRDVRNLAKLRTLLANAKRRAARAKA